MDYQTNRPIDHPDYLPISMLNQLAYCPHRFWLMYVEGEMAVNVHVLEGVLRHRRVHAGQHESLAEGVRWRRVYLFSTRLRLSGYADLIEQVEGQLIPVEYKKGRRGDWGNDQVQLCAEALCLEELTGQKVPYGELFYFGSRRRQRVDFIPQLRQETESTVAQAFDILRRNQPPQRTGQRARCRGCSLEPICLPREVGQLVR